VYYTVLQCTAVYCSIVQVVAVRCRVLQCVAVRGTFIVVVTIVFGRASHSPFSPTHLWQAKRALSKHQKSPMHTPKEPCALFARTFVKSGKSSITRTHAIPKKSCTQSIYIYIYKYNLYIYIYINTIYIYTRALFLHRMRPMQISKKFVHPFCLHTCEKRTEPYYKTKRAVCRLQMSPIHTPKEPYEDTKRSLSGH